MRVYTIGFTRRSAADFFSTLDQHGIKRVIDVRIHNASQLAGFTKRDDLAYFLQRILGAEYRHEPTLAPSEELLRAYRSRELDWDTYGARFRDLMAERRIQDQYNPDLFVPPTVLLCAEPNARECHRALILDYLNKYWGNIEPIHL